MINQLRADLDSLLKLNRNLAGFKTKVKSKVESFFGRISSTIDSQVAEESSEDSVAAASNILDVTQDIGRSVASTLEVGGESEIKQANISMLVLKKETRTYNAHGYGAGVSHWDSGAGVSVALPDQSSVTGANDTISVSFTSYTNLGSMMSDNNTGAVIRSPVLSVNVLEEVSHNSKRSIALTEPVEFHIQHRPMKRVRKRKCTYWEFKYAKWSGDGCYELRKKSTETMTAC